MQQVQTMPVQKAGLSAVIPHQQFTEKQQAVEDLATKAILAAGSPIDSKLIRRAVMAATGPEDLEQRLAILMKDADPGEFARVLERALWGADIMGYIHAQE
jgi:phage gp29-like protein